MEYLEYFNKIVSLWDKKRGLFLTIILLLSCYFFLLKQLTIEVFPNIDYKYLNIFFPIIITIIIFFIWLLTTNRIPLLKTKDITLALFLSIDEEKYEEKVKKIAKETILEIENLNNNIKIILHPINSQKTKKDLEKYLSKYAYSLDAAILAKVESGNLKIENGSSEEKIEIKEITFSGNFNVYDKFKIFKTTISISREIEIRDINKNWSYVESNSIIDKKKIKNNLKDSILFYAAIYLIYLNKIEASLYILKSLHNPTDSQAKIDLKNKKIIGNNNLISASRLNEILLNLFIVNSSQSYSKNNISKAYEALKECQNIFRNHPHSYYHYISLARYSYELGNIKEALKYTKEAEILKPNSTEIFLNKGFFAILNNNEEEIYRNYNELSKKYIHIKSKNNFTEIIGFLEKEKNNNKELKSTFEFAIGTLNYFYSDRQLGIKILNSINNPEFQENYPTLSLLIDKFLTKGETKSIYHKKYNTKNKKSKRKKRRGK